MAHILAAADAPTVGVHVDERGFVQGASIDDGSRWIIGKAVVRPFGGSNTGDGAGSVSGNAALVLGQDRLAAVISQGSDPRTGVLILASHSEIHVEATGVQGLLKKRPKEITVRMPGWILVVEDVNRLLPSGRTVQAHAEGHLAAALGTVTT